MTQQMSQAFHILESARWMVKPAQVLALIISLLVGQRGPSSFLKHGLCFPREIASDREESKRQAWAMLPRDP